MLRHHEQNFVIKKLDGLTSCTKTNSHHYRNGTRCLNSLNLLLYWCYHLSSFCKTLDTSVELIIQNVFLATEAHHSVATSLACTDVHAIDTANELQ